MSDEVQKSTVTVVINYHDGTAEVLDTHVVEIRVDNKDDVLFSSRLLAKFFNDLADESIELAKETVENW